VAALSSSFTTSKFLAGWLPLVAKGGVRALAGRGNFMIFSPSSGMPVTLLSSHRAQAAGTAASPKKEAEMPGRNSRDMRFVGKLRPVCEGNPDSGATTTDNPTRRLESSGTSGGSRNYASPVIFIDKVNLI